MSVTTQIKKIIKQAIDLHLHIGPEIIPRKYQGVRDLILEEGGNIKGMALKNHFYPTQPLISEFQNCELDLYGGIVLNSFQGGLNPNAIYASSLLSDKPIIVWLPTISAKEFLGESEWEIPKEWVNKKNFKPRKSSSVSVVEIKGKPLEEVLKMITKVGAILATGHISWEESVAVVKRAKELGVEKIILTHPIYQHINFPEKELKRLVKMGAKVEESYSMYSIDKISIERIASQIKEIGAENCFLSSDVGQAHSPSASESLLIFSRLLYEKGVSLKELKIMLVDVPKGLVG